MEFKIGDEVTINNWYFTGKVGTIHDFCRDVYVIVKLEENNGIIFKTVPIHEIKHYPKLSQTKPESSGVEFRVGDPISTASGAVVGKVIEVLNNDLLMIGDSSGNIFTIFSDGLIVTPQSEKPKLEPKSYFDGVRVGDKVYSLSFGEGRVCHISEEKIKVTFEIEFHSFNSFYLFDGTLGEGYPQSLFWSKPEFKLPKRKVKRTVEGWINIYSLDRTGDLIHISKEDADAYAHKNRLGEAVHIKHEYEVEE